MDSPSEEVREPLISIVIPIKNADLHLPNIEKILDQIQQNSVQIVIVHDIFAENPSPGLQALVKSRSNQKIDLLMVASGNPGSARNAGLEVAHGKWVSFWDADDEPNLENLVSMVLSGEESGCEICIGSFLIRKGVFNSAQELNVKKSVNQILTNPGIWRFSFRSDLISGVRFPSTKMGEDQVFMLQLGLSKKKIFFSKIRVYTYIQGSPTQSTNLENSRKEILESLRISLRLYSRQSILSDSFNRQLISRILLTTLKIYGKRLLSRDFLIRSFADLGIRKFTLLALTVARVALSMVWMRAQSKSPMA
jgi:glycosyltransferase involved in cell wall biosynthesis